MNHDGVRYWRNPTPEEIKWGLGCLHYCYFDLSLCGKADGKPKKWFKSKVSGRRWNRV